MLNDLTLDVSDFVSHPCKINISSWEKTFEAISFSDGECESMDYINIGLDGILGLVDCNPTSADVTPWFNTIPTELIKIVRRLPSYRLALLKVCHRSVYARELLLSSPIMAWLAWHYIEKNNLIDAPPLEIFNVKHKDILKNLGLVATKSSVKQVNKLAFDSIKMHELPVLLKVFSQPNLVRAFNHFEEVSWFSVKILHRYHWLAGTSLHSALALIEEHQQQFNLHIINDTLNLSTQLQYDGVKHMGQCKTTEALLALHDRLLLRLNREGLRRAQLMHDDEGNLIPIPAPPIPGNDIITPIDSFDALVLEGSRMHHCVASYVTNIQKGKYYVYHLSEPEKVTIGLRISNMGQVSLEQAKCLMNKAPMKKSLEVINDWLNGTI